MLALIAMCYHINNRDLFKVTEHRDLGILVYHLYRKPVMHSHYNIVAKAHMSPGLLQQMLCHLRLKELCI